VPLLLGLSLDEFSMAPASIPQVKQIIRRLAVSECREIAAHALQLSTTKAVLNYLEKQRVI
jgi:phosphoenolpyruvate-protein kinase (PTS system EI component)